MNPLTIHNDASESLHYNYEGFPVYAKTDELYRYGYIALCHWHPDLEFIYIVKGTMDYFINGKTIRLNQGTGVFVNSKRLHYGFSNEKNECTFIAVVIHPSIFEIAYQSEDLMQNKFGFENVDYIVLYSHVPWQKDIINQILKLHDDMIGKQRPLQLLSEAILLIDSISLHIDDIKQEDVDNHDQIAFLNMTGYIHHHYDKKLSIEDIAKSGSICRSKCCQLFKRFIKQSPNDYLTHYRLTKSCELLRDTHLSMTEIAMLCGFQTSSYFASVFKKEFDQTPKEYRKQNVKTLEL
ncbi:MAG: AraC family transcriptional regulator [Erysipelotrichaceae bacterium]|nr:AraC family transcriptional regulator [Erysipelotrichaceae bacterium]